MPFVGKKGAPISPFPVLLRDCLREEQRVTTERVSQNRPFLRESRQVRLRSTQKRRISGEAPPRGAANLGKALASGLAACPGTK